jgi:hypothetical protein
VCVVILVFRHECTKGTASNISYSVSGFSWTCVAKSGECDTDKSCTATISTDACNSVGGTCKSTCSGDELIRKHD